MSGAFKVGQRVQVKDGDPPGTFGRPSFCAARPASSRPIHGEFRNPEELAYGKEGLPKKPLYLVRFLQKDVWPDYRGARDTVSADIYEHWLDAEQ